MRLGSAPARPRGARNPRRARLGSRLSWPGLRQRRRDRRVERATLFLLEVTGTAPGRRP